MNDELNWLRGFIPKIPQTENNRSTEAEKLCSTLQSSDVIYHQSRMWQLSAVCNNLQETLECPELQDTIISLRTSYWEQVLESQMDFKVWSASMKHTKIMINF